MRLSIILALMLTFLSAEHREALLIGNSNYKHITKLNNPSSDLKKLKKSLEDLDFTVKIKTNLNSENLEESIELFQTRLARHRDTIGFLYYTGHGCQVDHEGYLIPTDVKTSKRLKVKHHALKISEMIETLKEAKNRVNMLFLDACRDVAVGTKGSSKGLGQIKNTPEGTLVMYATKAGETADDNSDFINSIIKSIQEPKQSIRNLPYSISDIFKHKRTTQKPIFSASDIPKIVLNGNGGTPPTPKPTVKPRPTAKPTPKPTIKPTPTPIKKYSLTITTVPSSAKVYITNIKPKYKNGIMLEKGRYTIKIKKDGYEEERFDVNLRKNFSRKVVLRKKKKVLSKAKVILKKKKTILLKPEMILVEKKNSKSDDYTYINVYNQNQYNELMHSREDVIIANEKNDGGMMEVNTGSVGSTIMVEADNTAGQVSIQQSRGTQRMKKDITFEADNEVSLTLF